MDKLEAKSLLILGRQPDLGLAELESIYGAEHIKTLDSAALLDIDANEINFKRLGGTIKVARVLTVLPMSSWNQIAKYLAKTIPQHLEHVPEGKFTLGVSLYGLVVDIARLSASLLEIKKIIKKSGRPVRVVPNKSLQLNAAQVLHNKLTYKGGWELLLLKDGQQTILAQTMFVQDIDAYAARDQARPKRDPRVGMLPPKLAQIIVNLAVGNIADSAEDKTRIRILDPFCGSGVILQEALLMGYSVLGSDNEPRMVEYTKANLQWLVEKYPNISGHASIETGDATNYQWPGFSSVASELYLGRALAKLPDDASLKQIVSDVNTITKKFLQNLASQLKKGRRICLAVPAWRKPSGELINLPLIAKLTEMGYNRVKFKHVRDEDLIYFREEQIVARELLVLEKD